MEVIINDIKLHVTDSGVGAPALVFLHYWGGSSRTWERVIASLSNSYRCIAPDLRGWGNSGAPVDDAYALADFASDVEKLIQTLELDDYVLVGHSMGGKIAQLLASRRPVGLAGVVLVAPAPPVPLCLPPEAMMAMQSAYESRASVQGAIDHMLTSKVLEPVLREQIIEDSLRGAPQAKVAWPSSTSREDISSAVGNINVPVLVVSGEHDQVDSVTRLQAELLPRIATARLHVLPGTGHLSPLESSQDVVRCVENFLQRLPSCTLG
jgi:3-oxoadipate enol-lactonase